MEFFIKKCVYNYYYLCFYLKEKDIFNLLKVNKILNFYTKKFLLFRKKQKIEILLKNNKYLFLKDCATNKFIKEIIEGNNKILVKEYISKNIKISRKAAITALKTQNIFITNLLNLFDKGAFKKEIILRYDSKNIIGTKALYYKFLDACVNKDLDSLNKINKADFPYYFLKQVTFKGKGKDYIFLLKNIKKEMDIQDYFLLVFCKKIKICKENVVKKLLSLSDFVLMKVLIDFIENAEFDYLKEIIDSFLKKKNICNKTFYDPVIFKETKTYKYISKFFDFGNLEFQIIFNFQNAEIVNNFSEKLEKSGKKEEKEIEPIKFCLPSKINNNSFKVIFEFMKKDIYSDEFCINIFLILIKKRSKNKIIKVLEFIKNKPFFEKTIIKALEIVIKTLDFYVLIILLKKAKKEILKIQNKITFFDLKSSFIKRFLIVLKKLNFKLNKTLKASLKCKSGEKKNKFDFICICCNRVHLKYDL